MVAATRLVSPQVPRLTPRPAESNKTARIKQNCVLQVFRARPRHVFQICRLHCTHARPPRLLQAPRLFVCPASIRSGLRTFHAHPASSIRSAGPRLPAHVYQICRLHSICGRPRSSIRSAGSIVPTRALSDLQAPPATNGATESNITRQRVLAYKSTLQFV